MPDRQRSLLQWWIVPGTITVLLLVFNSPWWRLRHGPAYRANEPAFGLFIEMNFAVWWSAIIYLLSAALFYEIAAREERPRRLAYVQLALLMLAVVIDEVGALHEWVSGLGGWLALAPFALVGLLLLGDSLRRLWADPGSRRVAWLVLIGFVVLASVALQEYAEHNLTSLKFTRRYGRFFEEATELVGAWIILIAAVYRRQGRLAGPTAAVVPNPMRMAKLLPIITLGLVPHVVAAHARLLEVGIWDAEPAAVYPAVVFFLLACYAFWVPRHRAEDSAGALEVRGFWSGVGLFFLLCSAGVMQNLYVFLGRVPGMLREQFEQAAPLWLLLLGVIWFIGLALWQRRDRRTLWLLAVPAVALFHLFVDHVARWELAAGVLAWLCGVALMRGDAWAATGRSIESPPPRPRSD